MIGHPPKEAGIFSRDPHRFLGLHETAEGKVIRLWRPDAQEVYLEIRGKIVSAKKVSDAGIFTVEVPVDTSPADYRVYHQNGLLACDPYACSPSFGELDGYLFSKGVHYKLYEVLGGRIDRKDGILGVKFAVWAPHAVSVSIIADFNYWDGRVNPMRSIGSCGVWELFVPGLEEGEKYKFEIRTQDGRRFMKADPFAYASELRPGNASIVWDPETYDWEDASWRDRKEKGSLHSPMSIYEVHLGSLFESERFPGYREAAVFLAEYCKTTGFTHVELLPIAEHPLDESWGYQVTGFYAVTSRYGSPRDFQYFVDYLHQAGIGVILDWVPAHFPEDDFGLAYFDGTELYEHADPRQGYHPHWNTRIFNYGRYEVSNFLLASALFWFDKMHIDGIRVDAVASMLYLDYGRKEGEWIPNIYGGKENLEAIEFLKHLNSVIHEWFPGALTIAEESTAFFGVTKPLELGGLGFDLKWNMGWMNDTLSYFKTDPFFRHYKHDLLTFGLCYAFSERFLLPLSHDEVVHGKGSLLAKMPGDEWQRFANLRLLYGYMICQPGKKLLFMGGEIGVWKEWDCKVPPDRSLLQHPLHAGLYKTWQDLQRMYIANPAFWEKDFDDSGFSWVDCRDKKNSIISYLRKGETQILLCVHNFTPAYFSQYKLPLQNIAEMVRIFCSDGTEYGGSGKMGELVRIEQDSVTIEMPPLATVIFEVTFAFRTDDPSRIHTTYGATAQA